MIAFHVPDMTCGHCASSITEAVRRVDAEATIRVDLPAHRVEVEASRSGRAALEAAIREAGYTPEPAAA